MRALLPFRLGPVLVLSALALSGCLASGRDVSGDGPTWPALSLSAGAQLFATVDTKVRVDSDALGRGTEIDLEDDLDLDDQVFAGRIDANWRFARRHALELSVFDLRRTGTRAIDRELEIGDVVFPLDARVDTEFETTVAKIAYQWSFLRRERWNAGLSLGTYWLDMSSRWEAGALGLEEELDAKAPLPVLGAFGSYALTPKLYLGATSEFFGLDYEQYSGFLNDTRLVLEHRTFEHLGFGVGFDYFGIDASVESETDDLLEAEFDYDYLAFLFFVRVY